MSILEKKIEQSGWKPACTGTLPIPRPQLSNSHNRRGDNRWMDIFPYCASRSRLDNCWKAYICDKIVLSFNVQELNVKMLIHFSNFLRNYSANIMARLSQTNSLFYWFIYLLLGCTCSVQKFYVASMTWFNVALLIVSRKLIIKANSLISHRSLGISKYGKE